jgi:integrase
MSQKLVKIESKDHYYFDAKSKIIYYLRKTNNEIVKFSTGIKYENDNSLVKASRVVSAKEKVHTEKSKKKNTLNKVMSEHFEDFLLRSEQKGDSKGTLIAKRGSVKYLNDFFGICLPEEVTIEKWLEFTGYVQKINPGYVMFNLTKNMKAVLNHLHAEGVILKKPKIFNPNQNKEDARRKKKRNRIYTPQEIVRLDKHCTDDQRLALWLGYDMGFRLDDCVKLTWDRCTLLGKKPVIEFYGDENKTKFSGSIPISDNVLGLLQARKKESDSVWVFPLKGDKTKPMLPQAIRFEDVVRSSGVDYGSHHLLRHTRLTEDFSNKDISDTLVMKVRRVSMRVALEHYIHPSDEDLELLRNTAKARRPV